MRAGKTHTASCRLAQQVLVPFMALLLLLHGGLVFAEQPRISNIFIDTDLRQALQDIGVQAGINVILDQNVGGIITAELDDVPLDRALRIMLAGTGFEVMVVDDYYLVYSPDESSDAFAETSSLTRVKINNMEAARARELLSSRFQRYVRTDVDANSLAVTASAQMTDRILRDLKQIDVPRKHVLLDARMVVLEKSDMFALGVDWTPPTVLAGTYTSNELTSANELSLPWGIRVGYTPGRDFTNALRMALNIMEENNEASVISSPQVLGRDGGTAEIRVTTEEYFEIVTEGTTQRSQLDKIETGALLRITPTIGDDNSVQLKIAVDVSDVVSRGERNLPVVSRRAANTSVQVDSGGTVAIGGLMDTRAQVADRGVPILGRIPLIRRLFSTDSRRDQSRQVAVFITATIVEPEADPLHSVRERREPGRAVEVRSFRAELREALNEMEDKQ